MPHRLHLTSTLLLAGLFASACAKEAPKEEAKPAAEQPKAAEPAKTETPPTTTATKAEAAPAGGAAQGAAIAGGTGIVGVVKYEGAVPAPRPVDMSKDVNCTKLVKAPTIADVEAEGGNLKNVFVYVKSGLPAGQQFPAKTDKVTLDQKGCLYHPSVLGLQVGQTLSILNSDPLLHNVHAMAKGAEFNMAMPKQNQVIERKLKKQQVMVQVKCDVHSWMQAWIGSVDHPFFAVTGADGAFKLEGLPKGTYELELWHPTLGTQTTSVTVNDGAASSVSVTFKAKA
ncbi:carboxypeptidase regulatory-like domain-containing protein [Myxococcota bacterium]|nr:carboxypeptidase regulatory-like domain-containing protein [Myxococcota bacterium]